MKTITLLAILTLSFGLNAKEIGRVTKLKGSVFRTNVDQETVRKPMALGEWVHEGDIIESDAGSFVKLLMKDDTIFAVGAGSKFAFEQFKMKTKNKRTATYNLMKGKLRSVFTKKSPTKSLHIKTPTASMGIRGTEIVSDVYKVRGKIRTDIALIQGKLEVTTKKGRKFDLKPSEIFESVRGSDRNIKNSKKLFKNRKTASQNFTATKRKLKKKIFDTLKKKPRKGGEVFLFDALKKERKGITKDAEFHSLTETNKVRLNLTDNERDRLSIFGDSDDKNRKKDGDRSPERKNKKERRPASADKDLNGRGGENSRGTEDKKGPAGLNREENIKDRRVDLRKMDKDTGDNFDFKPNVLSGDTGSRQGSKEGRRTDFFSPDQGPAKRKPASRERFQNRKFEAAPPINMERKKQPRGPRIRRDALRKTISKQINNPDMKRKMQEQIREQIKRQVINATTGVSGGGTTTRMPTATQVNDQLEKQKQEELERRIQEELQRKLQEELERRRLEELKNSTGL